MLFKAMCLNMCYRDIHSAVSLTNLHICMYIVVTLSDKMDVLATVYIYN